MTQQSAPPTPPTGADHPSTAPQDAAGPDDAEIAALCARFETATPQQVIRWAVETFGDALCLTTSLTDALLVHLAQEVDPAIEIVFIDTGYHFPETLDTLVEVRRRYRPPALRVARSEEPLDERWRTDVDACCAARKVAPLEQALRGKRAWLSGLRRSDSPERAATPVIGRDRRGLVKVNPLATWTDFDVELYVARHDIPINPLVAAGYPSVGCWPCTRPVADGADVRSGRWAGSAKTECGLHL